MADRWCPCPDTTVCAKEQCTVDDRLAKQRLPSKICEDMRPRGCGRLALACRKASVSRYERVSRADSIFPPLTPAEKLRILPHQRLGIIVMIGNDRVGLSWSFVFCCVSSVPPEVILTHTSQRKEVKLDTVNSGPNPTLSSLARDPDRLLLVLALLPTPHTVVAIPVADGSSA